jgi:hypothetical protein
MRQHSLDQANDLRRRVNRLRALQKIYRDCGWGSGSFDSEAFAQKRADFIETLAELELETRRRPRVTIDPQQVVGGENPTLEHVSSRLDHFLVQAAGEHAV